jgi:hypothetical protein
MSMQMPILGLVGAALVTSLLLLFFLVDPTSSPDEDVPRGGPLAGGEWDGRGRGNFTQREAEAFDDFDLYWLSPHYEGLNLQAILHTPQGQEVSFIYGSCRLPTGPEPRCAAPLTVRVQPLCKVQPRDLAGDQQLTPLRGQASMNRRGIDRLRESAIIWTGGSAVSVLPSSPDLNLDAILVALRGIGANRIAPGDPLPEPDFAACT